MIFLILLQQSIDIFVFLSMDPFIEDEGIIELSSNGVPYRKIDKIAFKKIEMVQDRVKMNIDVKFQNLAPEVEYSIERSHTDIIELFSKIAQAHKYVFILPMVPSTQSIILQSLKSIKKIFEADSIKRQAFFKECESKFRLKYIKRAFQLLSKKSVIKNFYKNANKSESPLFVFIDKKYVLYRHRQEIQEDKGTFQYIGGFFKGTGNKIKGIFDSKNIPVYKNQIIEALKTDLLKDQEKYKRLASKMLNFWQNCHNMQNQIHIIKKQMQQKNHTTYLAYIQLDFLCRQIRFLIDQVEQLSKNIEGITLAQSLEIMGDQFKQYDDFVRKERQQLQQHYIEFEKSCLEILLGGKKPININIGSLYVNFKKIQSI